MKLLNNQFHIDLRLSYLERNVLNVLVSALKFRLEGINLPKSVTTKLESSLYASYYYRIIGV